MSRRPTVSKSKLTQKSVMEPRIEKDKYFREIKCLFVYCKNPENNIPDANTIELYNFIQSKTSIDSIPIFNFNELQIIQKNPDDFNSTLLPNLHISNIKIDNKQLYSISDIEKDKNITIKISSDFCLNNQSMMTTELINNPENIIMVGAVEYEDVLFPGFIITFQIYKSKTIYIESLCSSQKPLIKGSSNMLNIINTITSLFNSSMDETHKITSHTLHALPGTREFYKKNRFIIMTKEEQPPHKQQPMKRIIGGKRKRKTRRKSRRLLIKKIIQ